MNMQSSINVLQIRMSGKSLKPASTNDSGQSHTQADYTYGLYPWEVSQFNRCYSYLVIPSKDQYPIRPALLLANNHRPHRITRPKICHTSVDFVRVDLL